MCNSTSAHTTHNIQVAYTCRDGRWACYDDGWVDDDFEIDMSVVQKEAYVVMYDRCDPTYPCAAAAQPIAQAAVAVSDDEGDACSGAYETIPQSVAVGLLQVARADAAAVGDIRLATLRASNAVERARLVSERGAADERRASLDGARVADAVRATELDRARAAEDADRDADVQRRRRAENTEIPELEQAAFERRSDYEDAAHHLKCSEAKARGMHERGEPVAAIADQEVRVRGARADMAEARRANVGARRAAGSATARARVAKAVDDRCDKALDAARRRGDASHATHSKRAAQHAEAIGSATGKALSRDAKLLKRESALVVCEQLESGAVSVACAPGLLGVVIANESLAHDRDVMLAAVGATMGRVLEHAPPHFKDDDEIVTEAVQLNGDALVFASARLQSDKDTVLMGLASLAARGRCKKAPCFPHGGPHQRPPTAAAGDSMTWWQGPRSARGSHRGRSPRGCIDGSRGCVCGRRPSQHTSRCCRSFSAFVFVICCS